MLFGLAPLQAGELSLAVIALTVLRCCPLFLLFAFSLQMNEILVELLPLTPESLARQQSTDIRFVENFI